MTNIDTDAESRAWAAARNVPDDVPDDVQTETWFLHGDQPIPGFAAHTEAAIRRIAHNSIIALDAREQAMGDLETALALLFDDDDPRDLSLKLPAVRRAWTAWKGIS
jgi:hypothetical protein